jgi:uncharacterized RDD family membrane protein YckC
MEPTERPRPSDDGDPDRMSTGAGGSPSPGSQPATDEGPPAAPPTWQSGPDQSPTAGAGGGGWAASGAAASTGTAGYYYADVPNRAIAYIIDVIILAIIGFIVGIVLGSIIGPTATFNPGAARPEDAVTVNTGAALISTIVGTVVNGIYFIGSWIYMRATPGQKVLGMQVGNETDGATLTMNQALIRWVLLGAPFGVAQALVGISGLAVLIGVAAIIWVIVLLVTTAQSPTKQGLHDRYAHSVVVKAGRSVS